MIITLHLNRSTFIAALLVFGIVLGGITTYSWTGPTGAPPNGNVATLINVGGTSQIKAGALSVNGFLNSGSSYVAGNLGVGIASPAQKLHVNGYARATGLCINTSCITSWVEDWSYGAISWTGWTPQPNIMHQLICPAGRVMTGLQTTLDSYYRVGAETMRLRCTVLTP